jgi:hypothetical protein
MINNHHEIATEILAKKVKPKTHIKENAKICHSSITVRRKFIQ